MTATVICRSCGWASFAVSRAYAEWEVARFNDYYEAADEKTRSHFAGPSSLDQYRCLKCNGTAFRPMTDDDRVPDYVTLNPIVCDALADDPSEGLH